MPFLPGAPILASSMTELDEMWSRLVADAGQKAASAGLEDVANYLRLKATNDAIRATGTAWLVDTSIGIAFELQRRYPAISVERDDAHAFKYGSSTMAGTLLSIRHGLRCLYVEAGWTRVPSHGVMRGAALARANMRHHGLARHDASMRLVHGEGLPAWLAEDDRPVTADWVRAHFGVLMSG